MRATAFASLTIVLCAAAADGPLDVRPVAVGGETRLRAGAELVLIDATALDREGRLVTGLRREQLRLFDEGVEQKIATFSLEDVPVSAAIVLDASGSMKRALPFVRAALSHISAAAKADDEFLVLTVRDRPEVTAPFSRDADAVAGIVATHEAAGSTAIIDALVLAFHQVRQGRNARKAILVFSDGRDTNSRYTWSELRRVARESSAPLYAFLMPGMGEDDVTDALRLRSIAEETGGRCVFVNRAREFPDKLSSLEIHRHYVVGFVPPAGRDERRYRRVRLGVRDDAGRLRLFWKRGYYP